ncbi:MAG: acyl-CoA dehydrogenase family protein, partial [Cumulibacter sp.]
MDSVAEEVRSVAAAVLDRGDGSWTALREAGLVSLVAPGQFGGEELGMAEVAVILREVGRRASDLPAWEGLAAGLLPLIRSGSDELKADLIPKVLDGSLLLVPALNEPSVALPTEPSTTSNGAMVTGTKSGVRVLAESHLLVVSTDGPAVLVDPAGQGVTRRETATSRGVAERTYVFDNAPVLGVLDGRVVRDHAIAGLVALGAGLVEGARDLTAGYIKERKQFGRALAQFQAVAQQIADVFIASRTFQLTADEVARRLDAGDPVDDDLAIAAYWFARRAPSMLQICHHLHGGMGVDVTYPLPKYFGFVRDVTRQLGGPTTLAAVPTTETSGKNAELTAEQRDFKQQARDYLGGLASDADRDEMRTDRHGPAYHRIIKQMGADGWMGVGWPNEYGGQGRGGIEQQAFVNEASRADIHLPSVTLQTVGPTLQAYGTDLQKEMFLSK